MSTALDPNVTHLLVYAAVAVLVLVSLVGAVLVILGRVKRWLCDMFAEWSRSDAFAQSVERILDHVFERFKAEVEPRLIRIEESDRARAGGVTRAHARTNEHDKELHVIKNQIMELHKLIEHNMLSKEGPQ